MSLCVSFAVPTSLCVFHSLLDAALSGGSLVLFFLRGVLVLGGVCAYGRCSLRMWLIIIPYAPFRVDDLRSVRWTVCVCFRRPLCVVWLFAWCGPRSFAASMPSLVALVF